MALSYGAPSYGAPSAAAPVLVAFAGPAPQRKVTVFFRIILAIPAVIVVGVVSIGAFVVVVISWFGALVMGRIPTFAADFLPGYVRWQARVTAYIYLMTDKYPPFTLENDDTYPVWVTAQPGPLNRWSVLFRIILAFPAAVVSGVLQNGMVPVAFVAWLMILFNGTMPVPLFQAFAVAIRYQTRVNGYLCMITSEWPWGLFGEPDTAFFGAPAPSTAYGLPTAPGAYGAPPAPGAYGAPTAPGAYGAPPAPGAYGAPPAPAAFGGPPSIPGVAFTFGGPSYLWGYSDDRSHCGIWSATDLTAPPQMWPIGEQGEGWARFRDLEPNAVALPETLPPPPAPPAPAAMPPFGAAPPPSGAAAPYPTAGSPADDPRWRIVLSNSAKQLVVVILVLGVILGIINRGNYSFKVHKTQQATYQILTATGSNVPPPPFSAAGVGQAVSAAHGSAARR